MGLRGGCQAVSSLAQERRLAASSCGFRRSVRPLPDCAGCHDIVHNHNYSDREQERYQHGAPPSAIWNPIHLPRNRGARYDVSHAAQ